MQVNLTNQDINYLVSRSGLPKQRIHQIVRKSNSDIFGKVAEIVFNEVD